jgi:hypothetical protein
MIDFVELCECVMAELSLLNEASRSDLIRLASEARKHKREYTKAIRLDSPEDKEAALNKLKNTQLELRRQYEPGLSDSRFEDLVKMSDLYFYAKGADSPRDDFGGLVFLTPTYIKKLEQIQ